MKIAVSACLLGRCCKYNGGHNYTQKVIDFIADNEVIEICPELLAGMPAPRPPVEIANGVVINNHGENVDAAYRGGVLAALKQLENEDISLVILKSRSPTCGVKQIYDGTFSKTLVDRPGIFAEALMAHGYTVIEDEDL